MGEGRISLHAILQVIKPLFQSQAGFSRQLKDLCVWLDRFDVAESHRSIEITSRGEVGFGDDHNIGGVE